jgi:hypothetical protein
MKYKLVEHQTLEGTVTAVHDGDSIKVVFEISAAAHQDFMKL